MPDLQFMRPFKSVPGSASADDLLYHYTSESGLRGIIESDRIWATDIRFLNDYTEFQRAFEDKYLNSLIEALRAALRKDIDSTAARVMDGMLAVRNRASILDLIKDSTKRNDTVVCSFTSSLHDGFDPGDRLSQWRGYSHSCQGFSMGFDRELLEKQIALDNPGAKASVVQCLYEGTGPDVLLFEDMGRNAALEFDKLWLKGEAVSDSYQTVNPTATAEYKKANDYFLKALSKATAQFFIRAARIKHAGFREECEWRIVLQASNEALTRSGLIRVRQGPFGETPYIEIPLGLREHGTSPLRRIVVGPGKEKETFQQSVERLLKTHGMNLRRGDIPDGDGVEVAISTIPYRSG